MYKRILVPLDGSRFSEEVLPYAVSLAAIHGTELSLLRVADRISSEDETRDYIDRVAANHGARGLCLQESGSVARALLEETGHEPATLLAMTSRGHSGLAELVLGSVAQQIMREAKEPILMYHPAGIHGAKHPPVTLRRVVLSLDGSELSEAIASDAAEFARWIGAELEVVNAVHPLNAADVGEVSEGEMALMESSYVRSKAKLLGKQYGIRISWDVLHGNPVEAIVDHLTGCHDVILAMATRRRDALETALLGSVTAGCLRKTGVPILMRPA
ncbi:MAG: universal stress protein [Candidimonas sp.]|nr:MAG: universal stress protein [Candidimonas sp.]